MVAGRPAAALVTGASGGVGRFAIQLAAHGGAHVTAVARRSDGLAALGAEEVVSELPAEGVPFDGVLESVGGAVLGSALARLGEQGTLVTFGASAAEAGVLQPRALYGKGASVQGMLIFRELDREGVPRDVARNGQKWVYRAFLARATREGTHAVVARDGCHKKNKFRFRF